MKIKGGKIKLENNETVNNLFKFLYAASYYVKHDTHMYNYYFKNDTSFAKNANEFINSDTELDITLLDVSSIEYKELIEKIFKPELSDDGWSSSCELAINNIYKIHNNKFDNKYVKDKGFVYGCHSTPAPNVLNILCNNFNTGMIGSTSDPGYYGKGIYFHNILNSSYFSCVNTKTLKYFKYHYNTKPIGFILVCKLYYDNYAFQTIPINIIKHKTEELNQDIQSNYNDIVKNKLTVHNILYDCVMSQFMNDAWYNGDIKNSIYYPNEKLDLLVVKKITNKDDLIKTDNIECGKDVNENKIINDLITFLTNTYGESTFEYAKIHTMIFSDIEDCKEISDYKYRYKRRIIVLYYTQMLLEFKNEYYMKNKKFPEPNEIIISKNKDINEFIKINMEKYDPNYYVKISKYIDEYILNRIVIINDRNYDSICNNLFNADIKEPKDFLINEIGLYALYGVKGLGFEVYTKDNSLDEFIINDTKLIEVSYLIELYPTTRTIPIEFDCNDYGIIDILEELNKKEKNYNIYN